jgi:DNA-binding transcriptional LysR family regulator
LAELRPYVLLPDGHPLSHHATVEAGDLAPHPMVLLDTPPSADYFVSILEAQGVTPHIALRSRSMEMVRGLVAHGLGYALLATKPAASVSYDGRALVTRPLATPARSSRIVLATRRGANLSPITTAFMQLCRLHFERR